MSNVKRRPHPFCENPTDDHCGKKQWRQQGRDSEQLAFHVPTFPAMAVPHSGHAPLVLPVRL
jgi:hypothetical protein